MKNLFATMFLAGLCACSSASTNPAQLSAPDAPRYADGAIRTASGAPAAYIAEVCERKNEKCKSPNGLVESLDGATITDGIDQPWSLAFDANGNLYVGNEDENNPSGTVTEYAPGSSSPSRTIAKLPGTPRSLGIDASNNLYVFGNAKAGCCGFVGWGSEYGPSGTKRLRALQGVQSFPGRPAFDSQGNLYVPNFDAFPGNVAVYSPGGSKPSRTIQSGIGFPRALAFDAGGNLYVLNYTIHHASNVTVYAPGSGTVLRTISQGMKIASALALDARGSVYVANDAGRGAPSEVLVYASGSTKLERTITNGVRYPVGLAFDERGNVLVANAPRDQKNTVTEYAPGAENPSHTYRLKESPTTIVISR